MKNRLVFTKIDFEICNSFLEKMRFNKTKCHEIVQSKLREAQHRGGEGRRPRRRRRLENLRLQSGRHGTLHLARVYFSLLVNVRFATVENDPRKGAENLHI